MMIFAIVIYTTKNIIHNILYLVIVFDKCHLKYDKRNTLKKYN